MKPGNSFFLQDLAIASYPRITSSALPHTYIHAFCNPNRPLRPGDRYVRESQGARFGRHVVACLGIPWRVRQVACPVCRFDRLESRGARYAAYSSGSTNYVPSLAASKVAFTSTPATKTSRRGPRLRKKPLSGNGFGVQQLWNRCNDSMRMTRQPAPIKSRGVERNRI